MMRALRSELRTLAAAVMYFTRWPLPSTVRVEAGDVARAITWFPLVGWLVGGVAALSLTLAGSVWPPALASGLALAATLLFTGALHEDGWADVCDGFGGGGTKERVLAIMKDSRIGAYGVIGLGVLLGLKWQAVGALPPATMAAAVVAAHALSRGAAASLMATLDYARADGEASKARPLVLRLRGVRLAVVVATALAPLALLPWATALAAVGAVALVRGVMARFFVRRIGGYTGDCLGATQQAAEVAVYLAVLACP